MKAKGRQAVLRTYIEQPACESSSECWRTGTLSDIAEVNPKTKTDHLDENSSVTFLPMECVNEDGRILKRLVRSFAEVKTGYPYFQPGDVLFPKITPCMENGKGAIASELVNGVGFGSTEFFILRPKDGVSPEYVYQVTRSPSFRKIAVRYMSGSAGQQRVQRDIFFSHRIPLPPFPEQQRIATVLATVDEAIAATDAIIAKMVMIEEEIAETLFSRPVNCGCTDLDLTDLDPVSEFQTVRLEEILSEKITAGYSGLETISEEGIPCLTLSAVTNNDISKRHMKKTVAEQSKVANLWIQKDDIFIERSNTYNLVGLSSIYEDDESFAIFPDLLIRVRIDKSKAIPQLIARYLRSRTVRSYFIRCAKGTSGSMKKIDQGTVNNVSIPLSPLPKQRRIAAILFSLDDRLATERNERDRLVTLKKGLMQVLLTGRVRVPTGVAEEVTPAHV